MSILENPPVFILLVIALLNVVNVGSNEYASQEYYIDKIILVLQLLWNINVPIKINKK